MALTKKMLKAMNLEDAQIEQIFEAHEESINALREMRDTLQADLEKANAEVKRLATVEKDLVKAQAKLEDAETTAQQLRDLKKEYSDYKADVDAKAVTANKEKLYKELLSKAGIPEKRQDAILRVTDLSQIELDKSGKIANEKTLADNIGAEWADFITTQSTQGTNTAKPPVSDPAKAFSRDDIRKMTPEEINKNWDSIKTSLKTI